MHDISKIARLITEDPDIFTRPVNEAFRGSSPIRFGWTVEDIWLPGVGQTGVEYEGTAEIEAGERQTSDYPGSADSVLVDQLTVRAMLTPEGGERQPTPQEAVAAENYFHRHIEPSEHFHEYIASLSPPGYNPGEASFRRAEEQWGDMGRGGL